MKHGTHLIQEGIARLRDFLPQARKEAVDIRATEMSGLATAMRPFLYESNLHSLVIAPGHKGGWIADLLLHDVPPGVSNCIGTPVGLPHATKAEAVSMGRKLVAIALAMHLPEATDAPAFLLHDVSISLFPEVLKKAEALARFAFPLGYDSAASGLERKLTKLGLRDACSVDDFDRLQHGNPVAFGELLGTLHACAALGLMVYPPREAAEPGVNEPPIRTKESGDGPTFSA